LDDYADFISSNPALPLKRVYMDPYFDFESISNLPAYLELSLTSFRRTCQERQIEIIFDPVPGNFEIDPCFPSDFMRRRRTPDEGSDAQGSGC
jgi:hypothetical protein